MPPRNTAVGSCLHDSHDTISETRAARRPFCQHVLLRARSCTRLWVCTFVQDELRAVITVPGEGLQSKTNEAVRMISRNLLNVQESSVGGWSRSSYPQSWFECDSVLSSGICCLCDPAYLEIAALTQSSRAEEPRKPSKGQSMQPRGS
jgi:hypothetical protein